ncbi:DUF1467 domain-containing protein [Tabrizicola sp. TH137]|uniref:DUF1467 family protein n=1 Tax=Tabrizicola sp. TH137 TaxID=2067452 RepID=UPI000C7BE3C6|nr:DUF1467 family protein [Tabrizicola sp. TH137]PLL11535.1 DUF1467 domain-containing protein [Tabrizicola sp. TH137]
MSITSAIVLYAVSWFMVFFIVLPIRFVSQGDAGAVVPGTPPGAPATHVVARKARMTTWIAALVWLVLAGIVTSGVISVRDIDWRGVMAD